mmetsp:Transcript_22728/g.71401  ORF Transcript_22728/g.71401 Transcript_22728/m.71401 type:complete len:296 (+) Transcript_22728:3790-4677(+)
MLHRSRRKLAASGSSGAPSAPAREGRPATAAASATPSAASALAASARASWPSCSCNVRSRLPPVPPATRASTDWPADRSARASSDASEMSAEAANPRSGPAKPTYAPSRLTLATQPHSSRTPRGGSGPVGRRPPASAARSDGFAVSVTRPAPPSAFGCTRSTRSGGSEAPGRSARRQSGRSARTSPSCESGSQPWPPPPPERATHTPSSPPPSSFGAARSCQPATTPRTSSPARSATAAPGGYCAAAPALAVPPLPTPVSAGVAAACSCERSERTSRRFAGSERSTRASTVCPTE